MTWQRDTVQLFLASGRDPFLRNVFFLLYWSFSSHVCASLLSEKHHKCQSVFLNASWKLFYDEQLPFSVFSQSDFSCNSAQIYILKFLFSQHELYSSQRTAVFPALSIRGKRNGQNRMSFFFYASYNSYWKHSVSGLHCTTIEAIFRRGVETQFVTAWLLNIMNKTVSVMTDVLIIVYHSGGYSWLCSAQKDCCLTLGSAESRPEPRWV